MNDDVLVLRRPAHSDFIVHWTGGKIAEKYNLKVNQRNLSDSVIQEYLDLLKSILRYGLWLKIRKDDDYIRIGSTRHLKPKVARVCFTELKISDSTLHAAKFGPLGIGFKRYFLFDRLGAPMHYVHNTDNLFLPPHTPMLSKSSNDHELLSFFINMSEGRDALHYIDYGLYEESEWRIIYSESIKNRSSNNVNRLFIDPKLPSNPEYHSYYLSLPEDNRPEYIIPLDEWFIMIIYPNIEMKNAAFRDKEIRKLLADLKSYKKVKSGKKISRSCPDHEAVNQVMEIAIGSIKNF